MDCCRKCSKNGTKKCVESQGWICTKKQREQRKKQKNNKGR